MTASRQLLCLALLGLGLSACQTSEPAQPVPQPAAEDPGECTQEYTGGAASALANSAQGCAVSP